MMFGWRSVDNILLKLLSVERDREENDGVRLAVFPTDLFEIYTLCVIQSCIIKNFHFHKIFSPSVHSLTALGLSTGSTEGRCPPNSSDLVLPTIISTKIRQFSILCRVKKKNRTRATPASSPLLLYFLSIFRLCFFG